MIRRASHRRPLAGIPGQGFTLLEMVVVIAVIAVLAGGAMSYMILNSSRRQLEGTGREVEMLAKRARAIAILRQTPYALEFHDGRVRLSPLVEAGIEDPEELAALSGDDGWPEDEDEVVDRAEPVRDELVLKGGMVLGVRRWGSDNWIIFDNERARMTWRFDPNGLCEPISVRFELDDGDSWLEQDYHPLTAAVRDFGMEAR